MFYAAKRGGSASGVGAADPGRNSHQQASAAGQGASNYYHQTYSNHRSSATSHSSSSRGGLFEHPNPNPYSVERPLGSGLLHAASAASHGQQHSHRQPSTAAWGASGSAIPGSALSAGMWEDEADAARQPLQDKSRMTKAAHGHGSASSNTYGYAQSSKIKYPSRLPLMSHSHDLHRERSALHPSAAGAVARAEARYTTNRELEPHTSSQYTSRHTASPAFGNVRSGSDVQGAAPRSALERARLRGFSKTGSAAYGSTWHGARGSESLGKHSSEQHTSSARHLPGHFEYSSRSNSHKDAYGAGGRSSSSAAHKDAYGAGGRSSSSAAHKDAYGAGGRSSSSAAHKDAYGAGGRSSSSAVHKEMTSLGHSRLGGGASDSSLPRATRLAEAVELSRQASRASSSSSSSATRRAPRGLVGLHNLGNTCFMNSTLQCLSNVPALTQYFLRDFSSSAVNPRSHTKGRMAAAYHQLLKRMWSSGAGGAERPSEVKAVVGRVASRFLGYDQHDAQEFLRFLLDALHSDVNKVHTPPPYQELDDDPAASDAEVSAVWWQYNCARNNSPLNDLFAGQFRSQVTCGECGRQSRAYDPFWDVALPIPRKAQMRSRYGGGGSASACDLGDCFRGFVQQDDLDGDYYCSRCGKHVPCTKSMSLYRCPPVLVLHMRRFAFSLYRRSKVTTSVQFPVQGLDVAPYCAPGSPAAEGCTVYDLVGVVNHMGSLGGGHYTADALNADSGKWYNFNDSRVSSTQSSRLSGSSAYLLFYVQRQGE